MQRGLLFVIALLLCCSCGTTLKSKSEKRQLDLAHKVLDSLNRIVTVKDIRRDIQKIEDNSRIRITKYTLPDSTGQQAIDYTVVIDKAVQHEKETELHKDEEQTSNIIHHEDSIDTSTIETKDKFEDPPALKSVKHIKGIIALILIIYIIYKFTRD